MSGRPRLPAGVLTALALLAFAGNSLLCRLALRSGASDPGSFTLFRLLSGAFVLSALVRLRRGPEPDPPAWPAALALAAYAIPFSFAYVSLPASTGALLLFGAVQVTMLAGSLRGGERPHPRQGLGAAIALGGLLYLLLPGLSAPPLTGAALMLVAGVAWGVYSILGRGTTDPLAATATNFQRAVPLAFFAAAPTLTTARLTSPGVLLALTSGAIASGLGYVIWYAALPRISRLTASLVQLAVPVLTAFAGVLLLGESLTPHLLLAGSLVLGGIALGVIVVPPRRTS